MLENFLLHPWTMVVPNEKSDPIYRFTALSNRGANQEALVR